MKIAIVHDWLITYAGAERVLEEMIECYPNSDLFALVDFLPQSKRKFIKNKKVKTSFIQKLPFAKTKYRIYLPLMPFAIEQFDLSDYDLVISSSHAVSKGVITGPNTLHICMCYSPIRYAWDLQHQYLKESNLLFGIKGILAKYILHKIRIWDLRTSNGVDEFIAISNFIKKRISKIYRRNSTVIYPPVDTTSFKELDLPKKDYYVTCSRMVPYKKIDLIVETFTKNFPEKELIVIGEGPEYKKIKKLAGSNIKLVGHSCFEDLNIYLSTAKAFIFAAEEDFGISPIEAQSSGAPVIAFGKGAALETIVNLDNNNNHPSGILFYEQTTSSLTEAIKSFESNIEKFNSKDCQKNAKRFSKELFRKNFRNFVESKITKRLES
tara:strand:+ start:411 stop:1550 length:1140 start_codon:yes stop_codon:yes gene_type:complete